jgi:hypothetical protein
MARESIVVAVYWFTNHSLFDKLTQKLSEGLKVELIIHNDYVNNRTAGLFFQKIIDCGGEFYFSDTLNPMHNKFCVIDNKVVINGSYNWTYYAEDRNRENILVVKDEPHIVEAFVSEFQRLKSMTEKVEMIQQLSLHEVDYSNSLNSRDYLANDIVCQAKEIGDKSMVMSAFEIAPGNIMTQQIAFDFGLTDRYMLSQSIGVGLRNGDYKIIVPKGICIPVTRSAIVVTSKDNQITSTGKIDFDDEPIASKNNLITKMRITKLPSKPAGMVRMKYVFTIDIFGNLRMEKFPLDILERVVIKSNICHLLDKVK